MTGTERRNVIGEATTTAKAKYKGNGRVDVLLVIGTSLPIKVNHLKATLEDLKLCAKYSIYVDANPKINIIGFDAVLKITADDLASELGYDVLIEANQ